MDTLHGRIESKTSVCLSIGVAPRKKAATIIFGCATMMMSSRMTRLFLAIHLFHLSATTAAFCAPFVRGGDVPLWNNGRWAFPTQTRALLARSSPSDMNAAAAAVDASSTQNVDQSSEKVRWFYAIKSVAV